MERPTFIDKIGRALYLPFCFFMAGSTAYATGKIILSLGFDTIWAAVFSVGALAAAVMVIDRLEIRARK